MDNENVNVTNENAQDTTNAQVENTENKVEAPVKADNLETIPNLHPTTSEEQAKLDKWIADRAKATVDKAHNPVLQPAKVLIINKDNPDKMYALRVRFPGTLAVADMQTKSSANTAIGIDFGQFMKLAVDNGVIVAPKINDVDSFFNNHVGSFAEAATKLYNFLDSGLSGRSTESED